MTDITSLKDLISRAETTGRTDEENSRVRKLALIGIEIVSLLEKHDCRAPDEISELLANLLGRTIAISVGQDFQEGLSWIAKVEAALLLHLFSRK